MLLVRPDDYFVITCGVGFVRSKGEAVLVAQLLLNAAVDLINRLLFRDFEESPAGFLRDPFQNLLSIRTLFLRGSAPPTVTAADWSASPSWITEPTTSAELLFALQQQAANPCVGASSAFDCTHLPP